MITVYTSGYGYKEQGKRKRLDITRSGAERAAKTGRPFPGGFLAPSAKLVYPTIEWTRNIDALVEAKVGVPLVAPILFMAYAHLYRAEMRVSFGAMAPDRYGPMELLALERGVAPAPYQWEELLSGRLLGDEVVLVCFCPDAERCHRSVAGTILERCGARLGGELR